MATHYVEVLKAWEHTVDHGPLVVKDMTGTTVKTIDSAPTSRTFSYPVGKICTFSTKKDAAAFCKRHGDKVGYLGTSKPD